MKKLLLFAAFSCLFSTNAQVRLVQNNPPGGGVADARPIVVVNNRLVYVSTFVGSNVIWSSNGVTQNALVNTVNGRSPRPVTFSLPHIFFNGELHFMGYYYNGSTINYTRLTKASFTNADCNGYDNLSAFTGVMGNDMAYPVEVNNEILFTTTIASSTNATGIELFKSDGTTISLVKDIYPGPISSNPKDLTVLGNNCFFSASGSNGRELWKSDGTNAGTVIYLDLNTTTSTASSNPDNLNVLGAQLTFAATHTTLGRELFKTNGTGSLVLIKDINTSGDSNPSDVTLIGGGMLYFSADNGTNGQELWSSNGNNSGTNMLKDINPSGDSNPSKFTLIGSSDIYFIANDGTNGVELWKTDGTSTGTVLVKNINPTGDSNPNYLTEYNGKLYFTADNGTNGMQLWVSDGTSTGTTMITINATGTSNISNLIVYNNELYFGADAGTGIGKQLYAYKDPALAINNFQLNDSNISLYPNPSKNYFELSSELTIEKVEVYSLQGQLVKSFEFQNQYDIANLSKGIYLVKVNTTEGSLSKSLIIE